MKLIIATQNPGKAKEIKAMLAGVDMEILSAAEIGIAEEVEEDGQTVEENALKKAKFVVEKSGEWAVADDTGLFIDGLNGIPGIYSARWGQEERLPGEKIVDFALKKMKNIPGNKRGAFFKTAAALAGPDNRYWLFEGKINGKIALTPCGMPRHRLPYDQIFIPQGYNCAFAEMSDEEKNSISHRGIAFQRLKKFLIKHKQDLLITGVAKRP